MSVFRSSRPVVRDRGFRVALMTIVFVVGVAAPVPAVGAVERDAVTAGGEKAYPSTGAAKSFWLHLNSTPVSDVMAAVEAKRHEYVVLNAWEGDLLRKLKASNPAVQVFVYKDLSSTRSYACRAGVDDRFLPAGIGYCVANRDHPEWFLTGPNGNRFEYSGYAGHWQMDVGNRAYQDAWATNVVTEAKATGFDGVFMDNALFPCDAYHPGVCPVKYPTDAEFQNAYKSMLANIKGRFADAGLTTIGNLSNARLHGDVWNAYTEHLDGGFDEWWLVFDRNNMLPEYDRGWSKQVAEISSGEARGKITWVQPHFTSGDEQQMRYAMASYYMVVGTRSAIAEMGVTDGYGDPTARSAMYAWRLGSAPETYRAIGTNLFRRDFACGVALVNANPTGAAPVRVPLGGTFVDEAGAAVTSVSLGGTSGAVLRKPCP
ncbi:putative glycoside hydrolase [Saccharothrix obliqua]|uniref:putative glycoside hydrolase n=1 Tax=Saccharothrix obliqua TaxID=2861747 RepID=UPI001C5D4359|nr:putative glycoside hydrolase [Saccharothrix obliqua]MBW4718316.1 putative glycoside hydrolase family 15 protein [Saccharothrix obliqua]